MLKDNRAVVAAGIKQRKSLDQLEQKNGLAQWQKWSGEFITTEQWR